MAQVLSPLPIAISSKHLGILFNLLVSMQLFFKGGYKYPHYETSNVHRQRFRGQQRLVVLVMF